MEAPKEGEKSEERMEGWRADRLDNEVKIADFPCKRDGLLFRDVEWPSQALTWEGDGGVRRARATKYAAGSHDPKRFLRLHSSQFRVGE